MSVTFDAKMAVALCLWLIATLGWSDTAPSFFDAGSDKVDQVFSQKGLEPRSVLFNRDGQWVGFIDAHGNIINPNGGVRGQLHSDGAVTNAQGLLVGEVNEKGEVIDSEGIYLGVIQDNGAAVGVTQNVAGEVIHVAKGTKGLPLFAPPSGAPPPGGGDTKQRPDVLGPNK